MQVRAYNHWAALLGSRRFPRTSALDASGNGDFGPYSVLLNFSDGIDNPTVPFIGTQLAEECGVTAPDSITQLAEVPGDSLLSRITDHYVQIMANQAPIGFEAEFYNRRGRLVLYRGILLPLSQDDRRIDHIYGVMNWKEVADEPTLGSLVDDLAHAQKALSAELRGRDERQTPFGPLKDMPRRDIGSLSATGPEFALLLARRDAEAGIGVVGEIPHDEALVRTAAQRMLDGMGTKRSGCR